MGRKIQIHRCIVNFNQLQFNALHTLSPCRRPPYTNQRASYTFSTLQSHACTIQPPLLLSVVLALINRQRGPSTSYSSMPYLPFQPAQPRLLKYQPIIHLVAALSTNEGPRLYSLHASYLFRLLRCHLHSSTVPEACSKLQCRSSIVQPESPLRYTSEIRQQDTVRCQLCH